MDDEGIGSVGEEGERGVSKEDAWAKDEDAGGDGTGSVGKDGKGAVSEEDVGAIGREGDEITGEEGSVVVDEEVVRQDFLGGGDW